MTEDSQPAPSLVLVVCNAAGSVVLNMRGNENVSLGGERCEVRGESKEKTESWIVFAQRKVYVYFFGRRSEYYVPLRVAPAGVPSNVKRPSSTDMPN